MIPSVFPYSSFDQAALTADDMASVSALECAHLCLAHDQWGFLRQMMEIGFDINAIPKYDATEENLLHRAIRLHPYDELAAKIDGLIGLGLDPRLPNGQSMTPLGLLCFRSQDMPNHRAIAAFEALERGGVRITDPCALRTTSSLARFLVDTEDAVELLEKYCHELIPWAQSRKEAIMLQQSVSAAPLSRPRQRI